MLCLKTAIRMHCGISKKTVSLRSEENVNMEAPFFFLNAGKDKGHILIMQTDIKVNKGFYSRVLNFKSLIFAMTIFCGSLIFLIFWQLQKL